MVLTAAQSASAAEERDARMLAVMEGLAQSNKRLAADMAVMRETSAAPTLKGEPAQKQQKRSTRPLTAMLDARSALDEYAGAESEAIATAKSHLGKGACAFRAAIAPPPVLLP